MRETEDIVGDPAGRTSVRTGADRRDR